MLDLEEAIEGGRPHAFSLFDLDGFKAYNDSFGHPAGDALLCRLGENLAAAVQPSGSAYRLGGDEFCVLAPIEGPSGDGVVAVGSAALSEAGKAFSISSSSGSVLLPEEADDPSTALLLADRRMYGQKRPALRTRPSARPATCCCGFCASASPTSTSTCAASPASRCCSPATPASRGRSWTWWRARPSCTTSARSRSPSSVLRKRGALTAVELRADPQAHPDRRAHPLRGARDGAGRRLVRSSHERWDGDGYPDRLAGEEIPLGARIIAVCDAFDAMVSRKPYRRSLDSPQALDELRRCAGHAVRSPAGAAVLRARLPAGRGLGRGALQSQAGTPAGAGQRTVHRRPSVNDPSGAARLEQWADDA